MYSAWQRKQAAQQIMVFSLLRLLPQKNWSGPYDKGNKPENLLQCHLKFWFSLRR